ncbi:MAG: histidine kinase [Prevotellaceae bacterium]|jgi:LytS/YehU family sensor histidine kinase|nr:histidine kinase [Prevotellaceae bacterium]
MFLIRSKSIAQHVLIHGFAAAHALTAYLLFGTQLGDSAILTILTVTMILFIARLNDFPVEASLVFAALSCFAGFYLGTKGAELFSHYFPHRSHYAPQVTTTLVTELLGWITATIFYFYGKSHLKALNVEIVKKQKARFQYNQLKQQLNPHFLFNSLNVLDYLVRIDANRASDFIKKMADVYRYMLNKESNMLVSLRDEINFSISYVDLLKERFDTGLEVVVTIPEQYKSERIIPCGVQLLIENATKHNVVSTNTPLLIKIYIEGDKIVVQNNLQLRQRTYESSGVGLSNIEGQYAVAFNKKIEIIKSADSFMVKIPLIK